MSDAKTYVRVFSAHTLAVYDEDPAVGPGSEVVRLGWPRVLPAGASCPQCKALFVPGVLLAVAGCSCVFHANCLSACLASGFVKCDVCTRSIRQYTINGMFGAPLAVLRDGGVVKKKTAAKKKKAPPPQQKQVFYPKKRA